MRFSEAWLREWVSPAATTEQLVEHLTMAGLEVDTVEPAAPPFTGVVVAEVCEVRPHPEAKALRVCMVDVGGGSTMPIVCGAPNVRSGMYAAAALSGSELPGERKILEADVRGVSSQGMLCSAADLGLAERSDRLVELSHDVPPGTDLRRALDLDDACIDIDLTPNRGDCLGVVGIAREVGALTRSPITAPAMLPVRPTVDDRFAVHCEDPADCPRYLGRVIRGVRPEAVTPLWMQERLRRSGVRSVGAVVDVTNYVMLELGQPMHAFDRARLDGGIVVRRAQADERLTLLDGQEVSLNEDTLVIADHGRAVALAGIMGGAQTAVTAATTDLLLECAYFSPQVIAGRARRYGLQTDASYRFERGVDPELQWRAMERATQLLLAVAGGRAGSIIACEDTDSLPRRDPVRLRRERIVRLLGMTLADGEVVDILERLGMTVTSCGDGWQVQPPSYRFDIGMEADLVEELARVHGYGQIPSAPARGALGMRARPEGAFDRGRAAALLVDRGYQEAITYSFVDPAIQELVYPGWTPIALSNPISAELSVMRAGTWPALLQAFQHNRNRQQERIRLFETGLRFLSTDAGPLQEPVLGGLAAGARYPEQWAEVRRAVDFFDIKGDVEALLSFVATPERVTFAKDEHPALHPGQTARILLSGIEVGWLGMVHPRIERGLDIDVGGNIGLFELCLDALGRARVPQFTPLSRFPSVRRDIAVVVDEAVSADEVYRCVVAAEPELLKAVRVFDLYRGEKIETGRKSLALGLILQDSSRTLELSQVDRIVAGILRRLEEELSASLRE